MDGARDHLASRLDLRQCDELVFAHRRRIQAAKRILGCTIAQLLTYFPG
jgi:hypothetical protein